MKAIAKAHAEPGLQIIDVVEPEVRPGCVKLRIEHGSVCGTDLHIYNWDHWAQNRIHPPRIVGHEFCGTVVEVGEGVTRVKVGDFVASESHIVDPSSPVYLAGNGHVDPTTTILGVDVDGGFSPFAVIPELNARPVPAGVPHNVASMMDALGNAVHTVMDGPVEGQTVLITGLGPIGMFAVAVCKALGAAKIVATEVSPYRIELGLRAGADLVLNPTKENADEVLRTMFPTGVDATLEMSGHPGSLALAIERTRSEGRISLLGVYSDVLRMVDFNQIVFKGLRLHGIVGRRMWDTWDQMTWLLTEKGLDVNAVITHHVPWQDFDSAMQQMKSGEAGKIVLDFSGG
ncbi:MAG: L-threonine 3-dehydrogenase [Armatimonadetes bacterium]|nr:L-threonine 3-dehydrogenase [Armatimonadota bacterium]